MQRIPIPKAIRIIKANGALHAIPGRVLVCGQHVHAGVAIQWIRQGTAEACEVPAADIDSKSAVLKRSGPGTKATALSKG